MARYQTDPKISRAVAKLLKERDKPPRISPTGGTDGSHEHPKESHPDVLVAAHNARAEVKRMADFVCDGVDDQEEINAAIAEAFIDYAGGSFYEGGGRVVLSGGDFYVSGTIDVSADEHGSLVGTGSRTTIRIVFPFAGSDFFNSVVKVSWGEVGHLTFSTEGSWPRSQPGGNVITAGDYSWVHDIVFEDFQRDTYWGDKNEHKIVGISVSGNSLVENVLFRDGGGSPTSRPPWGANEWDYPQWGIKCDLATGIVRNIRADGGHLELLVYVYGEPEGGLLIDNVHLGSPCTGVFLYACKNVQVSNVVAASTGWPADNYLKTDPSWPDAYDYIDTTPSGNGYYPQMPVSVIAGAFNFDANQISNVVSHAFPGNGVYWYHYDSQSDVAMRNLYFHELAGAPVVVVSRPGGEQDDTGGSIINLEYRRCFSDAIYFDDQDAYVQQFVPTGIRAGVQFITSGTNPFYPTSVGGTARWVLKNIIRRDHTDWGAGDTVDEAYGLDDHIVYLDTNVWNTFVDVWDMGGARTYNNAGGSQGDDLTLAVPVLDLGTNNRVFVNGVTDRAVAYLDSSAPATYQVGELWVDTSSSPPTLKYWDGTGWFAVAAVASSEPFAASGSVPVVFAADGEPFTQGVGVATVTAVASGAGEIVGTTGVASPVFVAVGAGNADRSGSGSASVAFALSGAGAVV